MQTIDRDPQRYFNRQQRMLLWQDKNRSCDGCKRACDFDEFDAHHIKPHSQGGPTNSSNVQMLCKDCHKRAHPTNLPFNHKTVDGLFPRSWQSACLNKIRAIEKSVVVACPAAGKTFLGGFWLQESINLKKSFVLIVSPSKNVRQGWRDDITKKFGIQLSSKWNGGKLAADKCGASICYAGINKDVLQRLIWEKGDRQILLILDEIHHGSDRNEWGQGASDLLDIADRALLLTGTPFRTDGEKVSGLTYDIANRVVPDFEYDYRSAVGDGVCRTVEFDYKDSNVAYHFDGNLYESRISECDESQSGLATSTLYAKDSDHQHHLIAETIARLEKTRQTKPDAAALFVCKPATGESMATEESRVEIVAEKIFHISGERPVVIISDSETAQEELLAFKNSSKRYLVAINMVSEGVNIPRLQVACLLRHVKSEMLFRQLFGPGRIGRQTPNGNEEAATVVLSQFPSHVAFASKIMSEADAGIRNKQEREKAESSPKTEQAAPHIFNPISASYEDGVLIHQENIYLQNEKAILKGARDHIEAEVGRSVPIDIVAAASKVFGDDIPEPPVDLEEVERVNRERLSKSIRKGCKVHSIEYRDAWKAINNCFGVYGVEQAIEKFGTSILDSYVSKAQGFATTGVFE